MKGAEETKAANSVITGVCKSPYLMPGTLVTLCFGQQTLGEYLVTEVSHYLECNSQYKSTFKAIAEMRWQVDVKNIREEFADINIITLHHRMLESSHPIITDIAGISSTFGGMYSELELTVNDKGNIVRIRNLETIQKKWQWVKQDMDKLVQENEALKGMISLNDELFSSDKKIAAAIEANEFFNVYFHPFWSKPLPSDRSGIEKNNLLNTHTMKWMYNGYCNPDYNPTGTAPMQLDIAGYPETDTNKKWLQQAYGAFEHLPLQGLKPTFEDKLQHHPVWKSPESSGRKKRGDAPGITIYEIPL